MGLTGGSSSRRPPSSSKVPPDRRRRSERMKHGAAAFLDDDAPFLEVLAQRLAMLGRCSPSAAVADLGVSLEFDCRCAPDYLPRCRSAGTYCGTRFAVAPYLSAVFHRCYSLSMASGT